MRILILFLTGAIFIFPLGKIFSSEEDIIRKIFQDSETIETQEIKLTEDNRKKIEEGLGYVPLENSYTFYIGKTKEVINAYGIILDERGKHGVITFLIAVNTDGTIKELVVLKHTEQKGAKIARKRFLRQFIGKSPKDSIKLKRDIISVTGATISSEAATKAAKRALVIWEEIFSKKK